ncbi:hypothetical protein BDF14DRAFT_1784544 [Spinellus fusiger]|nr:hypothetical protein BDF14DRAFT_1784544 [Spinellus fusiger]
MKEEEAAHDQRFGFEQETGFIYSLHDSDVVFNIRKAQVTENGRVIVHKRTQVTEEGEEPLHQHWTIELGDPLKVDSDDDEEDDRKRARLRSWFGNWSGWNKRHNGLLKEKDLKEAHEKVYKQKKASLSHELLAAAAAFEAVSAWEKKQEANGEPMRHSLGKKLIASLAAAELVKLYEERGVGEEEGKNEDQKQQSRSMMQKMSASAAENLFDAKHKDD